MRAEQYFIDLYRKDLNNTISLLRNKFSINYEYYHKLINDFLIDNNGYIEFSLTISDTPNVRFFFVYYDDKKQEWIKNNIDNILKNNLDDESYNKTKKALDIFKKTDTEGFITYGADITASYFKLYFVSKKLNNCLDKLGKLFDFPVKKDLENFDMIGLNVYKDKIDIKLYLVYNSPAKDKLFKYYKPVHELENWNKYVNNIETFISILPQYDYKASIAYPTLFNENCKKKLQEIPQSKGIFLNSNIYPTWLGFNDKAKLSTIYFRPKRDYTFKVNDNEDIVFKDKDCKDYQNIK